MADGEIFFFLEKINKTRSKCLLPCPVPFLKHWSIPRLHSLDSRKSIDKNGMGCKNFRYFIFLPHVDSKSQNLIQSFFGRWKRVDNKIEKPSLNLKNAEICFSPNFNISSKFSVYFPIPNPTSIASRSLKLELLLCQILGHHVRHGRCGCGRRFLHF